MIGFFSECTLNCNVKATKNRINFRNSIMLNLLYTPQQCLPGIRIPMYDLEIMDCICHLALRFHPFIDLLAEYSAISCGLIGGTRAK
jgi:hypothetical protein